MTEPRYENFQIRIDRKGKRKGNTCSVHHLLRSSPNLSRDLFRSKLELLTNPLIKNSKITKLNSSNHRGCNILNSRSRILFLSNRSNFLRNRHGEWWTEGSRSEARASSSDISVSPRPKHSQHLGNRGSLSRLLRVVVWVAAAS